MNSCGGLSRLHAVFRWVILTALSALAVAGQLAPGAMAADLSVKVSNIANGNGNILVAICRKETFLTPNCATRTAVQAVLGSVTVIFRDLMPGAYAAQVFHDEKRLGHVERDALGIPIGGYAVSNEAPNTYGPPEFGDSSFNLKAGGLVIEVPLHYTSMD
jgi:uncharacterized protein (DUF2141 family)